MFEYYVFEGSEIITEDSHDLHNRLAALIQWYVPLNINLNK